MGVVVIFDADPRWGREYETVAARVRQVLGATLVRDYLRAHPATATAYGRFKRLAAELPFADLGEYADLKDPVCDLVYLPAEEWAARTGWTPAGPDGRGNPPRLTA